MHYNSLEQMNRFVDVYLAPFISNKLDILDVGSLDVNGSYRSLFNRDNWHYLGLDVQRGPNVDFVSAPYSWDLSSNSFDVVISGQALEHVEYPWIIMQEISRVLKPGGLCCILVTSNGPEHRYPLDCYRYFPDGLKALAESAGIKCIESYLSAPPHRFIRQFYEMLRNKIISGFPIDSIWIDTVFIGGKGAIA